MIEAVEGGEARVTAEAPRKGTAGPDQRRIAGEGTQEAVDEIDHPRLGRSGILIGRNQTGTRRLHDRVLVLVKESGHERV